MSQQPDGSSNVTMLPSFPAIYSKISLFLSTKTYGMYVVSIDYCIAHHNDKMRFIPNSRYHIILVGNIEGLKQKLDAFCFIYRHVDCLYTLFRHRFSEKFVAKSGQVFYNVPRTAWINQRIEGVDRMLSITEKKLLSPEQKIHKPITVLFPNERHKAIYWVNLCMKNWAAWRD